MSGRVIHFEIPFDDAERAQGFYRDAFGWQIQSLPELNYTTVSTGPTNEAGLPTEPGYVGGGMMGRQEPFTTPVLTVGVDDIDTALEKIGSLGGSTVFPKEVVADMGFTAYFKDTEGNLLGLWENAATPE